MTEIEWLTAIDKDRMIDYLWLRATERKRRLLSCFGIRAALHAWSSLVHERTRNAVEVIERFVDGEASGDERARAAANASEANEQLLGQQNFDAADLAHAAQYAARRVPRPHTRFIEPKHILHIIGNPFRPVPAIATIPITLRQLAESVYQQNTGAVPALHDALLDAGLTDLADHFHDLSEWHPKGCWVIDLLTGRQ